MEAKVIPANEDRPPEPRIQLDLSLEEFAILEALRYKHLNGFSPVRTALERGFAEAVGSLHPYWRTRVETGREARGHTNLIEQVAEALS